jgi:MFS family permease
MSSLSIGRAWDEAKAALQASRQLIVPVALGMVLLPAVIVSMAEPQVPAGQEPPPGPWMLVALVMIIVMMIGQIAIVLLVNGWRGSVGEAIKQAARRVPTLVLAALAVSIPVILVFSIVLAFAATGSLERGQFDWTSISGPGWLLLCLCFLLLIYIVVRLLPLVAVAASETIGPIATLKRCFTLTSGHFWRLLGFIVALTIGFLIVATVVGIVIGGLVTIAFGHPEAWSIALLLIALAGGLVQAGFAMVYTAMLARIYAQLSAGQASVPEVSREG